MLASFPTPRPLPMLPEALRMLDVALPPARAADLPLLADLHAASRMAELLLAPWSPAQKRDFLEIGRAHV